MELRTYRAATMSDALALVRRELGPDATVLHTREVSIGRLFGLLSGQRQIEVTASRDVNIPSRLLQKEHSQDAPFESFSLQTYSRPQPATPSMFLQSARQQQELLPDVNEKLADLQTMVKELCRRSKGSKAGDLSEVFFGLFTKLIHADVNEELAQELVERLRREGRAGQSDPLALQARMARMIEADMRAAGPITVTPGQCRVAALVGPTGVGKTTTIAKLAANFRLKEKRRVGLITVDSYRIAAVEQLRMYANIIDLPVKVVSTPNEMREAVSQMSDLDLVLIDTAGRSPKDEVHLHELKTFVNEARADEVHLVLSSVADSHALEQAVERFGVVGPMALILTKLDEAHSLGNVLPVLRSSRLPLSYLTNGQNVPDDIEVADPPRLVNLIFGLDGAL